MTLFFYILRQLALGVVIAMCGMFFIAVPGVAVAAVNKIGGVGLSILLGFLPLVLTDLVPYLLPIAFLLAVVATYGRLAADSEWTSIRMAGIHPWRAAAPALVIAVMCTSVLGYLVHVASPELQYKKREYLRTSVLDTFRNLSPGQTELAIGQFYLNAPAREPDNVFIDALIHIPSETKGHDRTILADWVQIIVGDHDVEIRMKNARTIWGQQDTKIGAPTVRLDLDQLFPSKREPKTSWKFQSTSDLVAMIGRGEFNEKDTAYARYEVQDRWTLMFTPLLFFLLGVPTGLLTRSSTQLGALAIAVVYALAYYVLSMQLSKELSTEAHVHEIVAAWFIPLVGSIYGAFLCRRAFRQ